MSIAFFFVCRGRVMGRWHVFPSNLAASWYKTTRISSYQGLDYVVWKLTLRFCSCILPLIKDDARPPDTHYDQKDSARGQHERPASEPDLVAGRADLGALGAFRRGGGQLPDHDPWPGRANLAHSRPPRTPLATARCLVHWCPAHRGSRSSGSRSGSSGRGDW